MRRSNMLRACTKPMSKEEILDILIQDMEDLRDPETRWELDDANINAHIFYIKELAKC